MKSNTIKKYDLSIIKITIATLIKLLIPLLFSYLIDTIILENKFQYINNWTIISLVILSLSSILSFYFIDYLIIKKSIENTEKISNKLVNNLLKMDIKSYESKEKSYYYNVINNSASIYADLHAEKYLVLSSSVLLIISILLIIFTTNIYFGLLFLAFIPLVVMSSKTQSKKLAIMQREALLKQDKFLSNIKNIIESKKEISIIKKESFFYNKAKQINHEWTSFILKYKFLHSLIAEIPTIISNIYNVIFLSVGAILISNNNLTPGILIMGYQYLGYIASPVINCSEILIRLKANKEHIERVETLEFHVDRNNQHEFIRTEESRLVKANNFEFYKNTAKKELLFYIENLEISNKGLYLIKGRNGVGKSSLFNYILGYSDYSLGKGDISISNKIEKSAYLTYPIFFFDGSFKENIFNIDYDKRLIEILNIDFEDKEITTNPLNISLGEQQKIALMRVLSMESNYLLLDEPLSNLDKITQDKLKRYLLELKENKTIVAIMHDNSFDDISDKIYTIENNIFN